MKENTKTILQPVYTRQKSFYGKAYYTTEEEEGFKIYSLYSYNTLVLQVIINDDDVAKSYYIVNDKTFYSSTTSRHVKEFIHQKMTTNMNAYRSLNILGFTKNNIIAFTRTTKPLEYYKPDYWTEKRVRKCVNL